MHVEKIISFIIKSSWLKYTLALTSLVYLFVKLKQQIQSIPTEADTLFFQHPSKLILLLFTLTLFSCLNWITEAFKWHILINQLTNNTWKSSFKESFMAHAIGIFTPNKVGDHFGKLLFHPTQKKKDIIQLSLVQHLAQLLTTLFFGVIGTLVITRYVSEVITFPPYFIMLSGFLLFVVIVIVGLNYQSFKSKLKQINLVSIEKHKDILVLSVIKYLIFSHLFIATLYLLGAELPYVQMLVGVWCMYFVSSIIPTFMVTDLIVKSGVAVFIFSAFGVNESILVISSLLMWLFNFVLPALLGNFYLLQRKSVNKQATVEL